MDTARLLPAAQDSMLFAAFELAQQEARQRVATLLDQIGEPLMVVDRRSNLLHATPAALALLGGVLGDQEMVVRAGADVLHNALTGTAGNRWLRSLDTHDAKGTSVRCDLTYSIVAPNIFDREHACLIRLVRTTPRILSREELAKRFRITDRECDVVELLTEGTSNAEIASTLRIREATARHHVEAVMRKLGVRKRGAVTRKVTAMHGR